MHTHKQTHTIGLVIATASTAAAAAVLIVVIVLNFVDSSSPMMIVVLITIKNKLIISISLKASVEKNDTLTHSRIENSICTQCASR